MASEATELNEDLEHCTQAEIAFIYVLAAVNMLLIIPIPLILARFIRSHTKEINSSSKLLFCAPIVIVILTILSHIGLAFGWNTQWCIPTRSYLVFMFLIGYSGQWLTVVTVLFYRLYVVFRESALKLSTCTVRFYVMILVFVAVFLPGIIVYASIRGTNEDDPVWMFSVATVSIILIAVTVSISAFFVQRLFKVYSQLESGKTCELNDELLAAMTKNTTLSVVSTLTALLVPVCVILEVIVAISVGSSVFDSVITLTEDVVFVLDLYTNFLCVFLSYSSFDDVYAKLCGCLDIRVKQYFVRKQREIRPESPNSSNGAIEIDAKIQESAK